LTFAQSGWALGLKGKVAMRYKVGLILILFLGLVACGKKSNPTQSNPTIRFESSHSDCKEPSGTERVDISSSTDTIRVAHFNAHYNTCAKIKVDVVKSKYGFDLFEKDEGKSCDGMCYSDVTTIIYDLSAGTYLIRVFDTTGSSVEQGYAIIQPTEDDGPQG